MSTSGKSDEQAVLHRAMQKYKMEIAEKLGLKEKVEKAGWQAMSTSECGRIGGKMSTRLSHNLLRHMIESVKKDSDSK